MKKIILATLSLILLSSLTMAFAAAPKTDIEKQKIQKAQEKMIIGSWVNPYTFESTGEYKGMKFEKGGKCSTIGVPSWILQTWKIEKGWLITTGININDDGSREPFENKEKIDIISKDSIRLMVSEKPKVCFLYINMKAMDKITKKK